MMPWRWLALGLVLAGAGLSSVAQTLRDPTVPPAAAGMAPNEAPGAAQEAGMTVIVRDGRSFLAVGTRLYAPGQRFGDTRVERITETEVWLREGRVLRKVPRFAGIQRHAVTPSLKKPIP